MRARRELDEAGEVREEALAPAPATPVDRVLALQQQVGNAAVSRKLAAGAAGDQYEQEADRPAAQVSVPAAAQDAARSLGAQALRVGQYVVLAPEGSPPDAIGHELAHVVQQRQGRVRPELEM